MLPKLNKTSLNLNNKFKLSITWSCLVVTQNILINIMLFKRIQVQLLIKNKD